MKFLYNCAPLSAAPGFQDRRFPIPARRDKKKMEPPASALRWSKLGEQDCRQRATSYLQPQAPARRSGASLGHQPLESHGKKK